MATGDQIVFSFDVDRTAGFDFRQSLVLDTNGFMRVRHLDGESPPRTSPCTDTSEEDCFGTSLKLPPGLILADGGAGAKFFLTSRVDSINLNTKLAAHGILKLEMMGRPADGPSAADPNTAPVAVHWVLTILPPRNERAIFFLTTRVTVEETVSLSSTHLANAEAFRAAEFSSSNVDADHTSLGQRTRDADELRVFVHRWRKPISLDLNSVPRNELLFKHGLRFRGPIQLNQLQPAP
jgi:hypothetical protein